MARWEPQLFMPSSSFHQLSAQHSNSASPFFAQFPPVSSPSYPLYVNCPQSQSVPPQIHSNSNSSDGEVKPDKGKLRMRRYKTPSPQLLRSRRNAANERERRRMLMLNLAYDKLRTVLPDMDSGRRLSKYETLVMAQQYIKGLSKILDKPSNMP